MSVKPGTPEFFWARFAGLDSEVCWTLPGAIRPNGYAGTGYRGEKKLVHRLAYELAVGEIPEGLVLDHLCRNRACCNPRHLEPVTHQVNLLRGETHAARNAAKSHCPEDHPYDESNTYHDPSGRRVCRICARERGRRYDATHRSANV